MIELFQSKAVGVAELIPFPIRVGAPIKACLSEWSLIIFEVYGLQPNTSPWGLSKSNFFISALSAHLAVPCTVEAFFLLNTIAITSNPIRDVI